MQEIIQEALSNGVKMHVAGEFESASQLYDSVIKLQPDHAEANHNMGLLKIDTGNDLEALPYLQTALEADKSITKFWLSYIKLLINLDRKKEASRILSLAKENGADDDEFLELERTLNKLHGIQIREELLTQSYKVHKPRLIEEEIDDLKIHIIVAVKDGRIVEHMSSDLKNGVVDIFRLFVLSGLIGRAGYGHNYRKRWLIACSGSANPFCQLKEGDKEEDGADRQ